MLPRTVENSLGSSIAFDWSAASKLFRIRATIAPPLVGNDDDADDDDDVDEDKDEDKVENDDASWSQIGLEFAPMLTAKDACGDGTDTTVPYDSITASMRRG
jgi:hypothetical protein